MDETASLRPGWRGLRAGAVWGATAWIAGLLLTAVLGLTGASAAAGIIMALAPVAGAVSAYLFFHAWLALGAGPWGVGGFTVVPVGLLLAAGYVTAAAADARDARAGLATGAAVTAGYFPAALVSVGAMYLAVAAREGVGEQLLQDAGDVALGAAVAGVVFPVVFGGLGGLVAVSRNRRSD